MAIRERTRRIIPAFYLSEIYGETRTYHPREPYGGNPFVPQEADVSNFLTGSQLVIAGKLPAICHRAVATPRAVQLIQRAGFCMEGVWKLFDRRTDHASLLSNQAPRSVVFQHFHPPDQAAPALYWISPDVLAYLNNKGNLGELVPPEAVPGRYVLPTIALATSDYGKYIRAPVVIKVPSNYSLGSGEGVRICQNAADIAAALADFSATEHLIVEEFLNVKRNWCAQYACTTDREVCYLGTAEQIVDKCGRYRGNWITAASPPEEVIALGREIAERGLAIGYQGVAGFDIVQTEDGRIVVLDLNFRVNGSTLGLLFRPALQGTYGADEIMFRSFRDARGFEHMLRVLEDFVEGHLVFPFATYDPNTDAESNATVARCSSLIAGRDRRQVIECVKSLERLGLHS